MTVEKARKILGPKFDKLNDDQIMDLIKLFESISLVLVQGIFSDEDLGKERE